MPSCTAYVRLWGQSRQTVWGVLVFVATALRTEAFIDCFSVYRFEAERKTALRAKAGQALEPKTRRIDFQLANAERSIPPLIRKARDCE